MALQLTEESKYFVFEFKTTLDAMLDKYITITVIKPGGLLRKRKILGGIIFDMGTVWYEKGTRFRVMPLCFHNFEPKGHQLYHKWAILTPPNKDLGRGTRGYLKLDVSILTKGESPKIPIVTNTDEIEGNLFMPHGVTRQRQRIYFIFDIFHGLDMVKKNQIQENTKPLDNPPTTLIRIRFSANQMGITDKKHSFQPIWNQRLILPELFPPLCQRFKIELVHGNTTRAIRYLNLRSISNDKEEGFLPTFGPAFLHFYSPNPMEGYLGKVFLSLKTNFSEDFIDHDAKVELSNLEGNQFQELSSLNLEDVMLIVSIFDVSFLNKNFCGKPVSFRISCGALRVSKSKEKTDPAVLKPLTHKIVNENHSVLEIETIKPCLFLTLSLPDVRNQMYNRNILSKMLKRLKQGLDTIEKMFQESEEQDDLVSGILDFITSAANKYLDIASNYIVDGTTTLNQKRLSTSLKQMEAIILISQSMRSERNIRTIFHKLEKICTKIENLIDEVDDWPRVYLWMIYANKRVAYHIIDPQDIIDSPIDEQKGEHCGVFNTIYLQTENSQNVQDFVSGVCKMDIIAWMGLPRHLNNFTVDGFNFSSESLSENLTALEVHRFQARVHIFQGKIILRKDRSGLCDPYVQFFIGDQFRQTKVVQKTLHPVWNQTLVFRNLTLCGTRDFIVAHPPSVIAEIYDKDVYSKHEFVGRSILKPVIETTTNPYSFPRLLWHNVYNKSRLAAAILVATELFEILEDEENGIDIFDEIPKEIRPNFVNHRIEVLFWGMRNLKKMQMMKVNKAKIMIECYDISLVSDTLSNFKKNQNFTNPIKIVETSLPEQHYYAPPLCLKLYDCRSFGINVLAGVHLISMQSFFYTPYTTETRNNGLMTANGAFSCATSSTESFTKNLEYEITKKDCFRLNCLKIYRYFKRTTQNGSLTALVKSEKSTDDIDWWTRFYASVEENLNVGKNSVSQIIKLKIYPNELESQPEFGGFKDCLSAFAMYKGKSTDDEDVDSENTTGIFKGAIKIYEWPPNTSYVTESGLLLEKGVFQNFPLNSAMQFTLRVYCVRGLQLRPKDFNGTSDPYIRLTFNKQVIDDKKNAIMGEVNPIFGKCFELKGTFPQDHQLTISVLDWDAITSDDLIGETMVDLENRYYTRHRAHCGLAEHFSRFGYCQWRDAQNPLAILRGLCLRWNVSMQLGKTWIKVASKIISPVNFSRDIDSDQQILALEALNHWSEIPLVGCRLVPEHVETRSLFHPDKPGIEQGKLQLWIDILPLTDMPTPGPVNITPQEPVTYELRVIVWNAEKIRASEVELFTGDKKSDIFIKGWMISPDDSLYTDVHYRSLTGEANFNWRFIFRFDYSSNENNIIVKTKSMFGLGEVKTRIPCKLTLQAWDMDFISSNDFLGILSLDLTNLPRGALSFRKCKLSILEENVTFNLFKTRRSKGWWPLKCLDLAQESEVFAGALELEFELLTKEDADKSPVGLGRDAPQPLPLPNRPESSFAWFSSPWKVVKYALKSQRWRIMKILMFVLLAFFILAGIYALPSYSVKKLLRT